MEKPNGQAPHSFVGLQMFMFCIGLSLVCAVVLMIMDLFKGLGFPGLNEIASIAVGVLTIYLLRERSAWGYWLGILYAAGFFAAGCLLAAGESGFFFKVLGFGGLVAGIYFMAYLYSRRNFFD